MDIVKLLSNPHTVTIKTIKKMINDKSMKNENNLNMLLHFTKEYDEFSLIENYDVIQPLCISLILNDYLTKDCLKIIVTHFKEHLNDVFLEIPLFCYIISSSAFNIDVLRFLIEMNADFHMKNRFGDYIAGIFIYGHQRAYREFYKFFCEKKNNAYAYMKNLNYNPISFAYSPTHHMINIISRGRGNVHGNIRKLLENGLNLNMKANIDGSTIFETLWKCKRLNVETVEMMLLYNADIYARNKNRLNIVEYFEKDERNPNSKNIVEFLYKYDAERKKQLQDSNEWKTWLQEREEKVLKEREIWKNRNESYQSVMNFYLKRC